MNDGRNERDRGEMGNGIKGKKDPQNPKKTTVLFSAHELWQFFGLKAKTIIARSIGFTFLDSQNYENCINII